MFISEITIYNRPYIIRSTIYITYDNEKYKKDNNISID